MTSVGLQCVNVVFPDHIHLIFYYLFAVIFKRETLYYSHVLSGHSKRTPKNWPTGVYLLDFYCSGIQFYLLLSPYLCFISLLYLDLYVLGDDAFIS